MKLIYKGGRAKHSVLGELIRGREYEVSLELIVSLNARDWEVKKELKESVLKDIKIKGEN